MATKNRSTVRLWRWRTNPLQRRIDAVEAWIILAAWLCAAVGGLLLGCVAGVAADQRYDRIRTEHRPASAVVVKATKPRGSTSPSGDQHVWATVRWTGTDGQTHTGRTQVQTGASAGDRTRVWTNPQDQLTAEPLSPTNAMFQSGMVGFTAAAGAGLVVLLSTQVVLAGLDRRRLRQWADAWEQADRRWGGTTV